MNSELIISYLKQFRQIPTFQLERRIDPFLYPYLEPAFSRFLGTSDIKFIYPEFPLWPLDGETGLLRKKDYSSAYADYVLWSAKKKTVYFVELKTDSNSVSADQFKTYLCNCKEGWEHLFRDFFEKAINSTKSDKWRKFAFALDFIYGKAAELTGSGSPFNLDVYYKRDNGRGVTKYLEDLYHSLHFSIKPDLKFIYLAPGSSGKSLSDLVMENKDSRKYFLGLFELKDFARSADGVLNSIISEL